MLLREHDSNAKALWGLDNLQPFVKDAFHRRVIHNEIDAGNPAGSGTKACGWYLLDLAPGRTETIRMRLADRTQPSTLGQDIDGVCARRMAEADEVYCFIPAS